MGKGERRGGRRGAAGRRRNRRRRHNRHHHRTAATGIRFMRDAVPGTEYERSIYARALTFSISCYCVGLVLLISGIIGFLVMLYIAITLLCLGLLASFWTLYLYKKLKLAEASVASSAVTSGHPNTGLNTPTLPVFMLGNRIGLSNSTSNINSQATENGLSNTVFAAGSGNLSSSMPNVAAPSFITHLPGTTYHYPNQTPLDQPGIGVVDTNTQILSALASYCQYKHQCTEISSVPVPTNHTIVDMEPPPPSYDDVVK